MKNKVLICLLLILLITMGCTKKEMIEETPLMEFDKYQDIKISEVN